jgi:hypothetical protein
MKKMVLGAWCLVLGAWRQAQGIGIKFPFMEGLALQTDALAKTWGGLSTT